MGIWQKNSGKDRQAEGSGNNIEKIKDNNYKESPASGGQLADLLDRIMSSDESVRYTVTMALSQYPEQTAVDALLTALKDKSARVRACAAESLRFIAATGFEVNPVPILDALMAEPLDSDVHYFIEALREISGGLIAERAMEIRREAVMKAMGGPIAEKLQQMRRLAWKLHSDGEEFESAFTSLFSDLQDENPEIRAEASRLLAEKPKAIKKLISIYQQNSQKYPRKSVLAGRVLGRMIDAGEQKIVYGRTSVDWFGLNITFTPCVCAHCDNLNVGIPIPEGGLKIPFYSQKDDQNCAYSLPVICDHCGKEFFVVWDSDPR